MSTAWTSRFQARRRGFIDERMGIGVVLQERGWTLRATGAIYHGLNRGGFMRAVGHDQDVPGAQNCFQTGGDAFCGSVVAAKPFPVGLDGNWFQSEQAARGIFFASRFIEAEMAILTEAKNDHIDATGSGNLSFVFADAIESVRFEGGYDVKLRAGNAPRFSDCAALEIAAAARFIQGHADVFVEGEDTQ